MYTSKRVLCNKANEIDGLCKFHYGVQQKRLRNEGLCKKCDELVRKVESSQLHWLEAEEELKKLNVDKRLHEKTIGLIRYYCGITW
jgi:uncharacterized membrane protein YjjP (DUF1212 family)